MSIILSEAAHCEHQGCYGYESNHIVGNQDGTELRNINYYNLPWQYVFRCKNKDIAKAIAVRQMQAADNRHIGYSQPNRATYLANLLKVNYDPSKIAVDCDADCSALTNGNVYVTLLSVGLKTNITGYEVTAQMPAKYAANPWFTNVTSQIDLATGKGLQVGDILVTPSKHTAVCTVAEESYKTTPLWVGKVTNCTTVDIYSDLNKTVRCGYPTLGKDNLVDVCDETDGYYYIRIAAKYFGFIEKKYLVNANSQTEKKYGTVKTTLYLRGEFASNYKDGKILTAMPTGATVTILGYKAGTNNWYKVEYNGITGYCSASYISIK